MNDTEKYAKELAGIPFSELAMTKDGKICRCEEILCRDCYFYKQGCPTNWLEQEAKPEESTIAELRAEAEARLKELQG